MKISKLIFLSLAVLVAGASQAQTVLFSWQTDGVAPEIGSTASGAVEGGSIEAGRKSSSSKTFSVGAVNGYVAGTAEEYMSTGGKYVKVGSGEIYLKVTPNVALKEGDVVSICGFGSYKLMAEDDLKTSLQNLAITTGVDNKNIAVGSAAFTADYTGSIFVCRSSGSSLGITAIRIVRPAAADPADATLSGIAIDGKAIAGFDKETTSYEVEVPYGTTVAPKVAATASNKNATVVCGDASIENGVKITVTSSDKTATKEYTVNFKVKSVDLHITSVKLSNGAYATVSGEIATFPYVASLAQPTVDFDNCVVADKENSTLSVSDGKLVITGADNTSAEYAISYREIAVATSLAEATEVAFDGNEDYVYAPGGYKAAGYYVVSKAVEETSNARISADKIHLYIALPKAEKAILTSATQTRTIKVFVNGEQISSIEESGAAGSTIEIPLSATDANLVMIESNQTSGDGGFSKIQLAGIQKDTTDPTAIKSINANTKTTKGSLVIKNNALVIVRGGKTYNLLGQEL